MRNFKVLGVSFLAMQLLAVLCVASPKRVSLVSIIANPQAFTDKMVSVDGCVSIGFERNAIFLSRFDFEYYIFPNSFMLRFEGGEFIKYKDLDGKACRVTGTFRFSSKDAHGVLDVEAITELNKFIKGAPH